MDKLGLNIPVLVAQLVNFLILLAVLRIFVYPRIVGTLSQRSNKIKESLEQADKVRQQTYETEERIKAQLDGAREETQKILAQATQTGDKMKEEAKAEARKEAENIIARSREEIRLEREQAMSDLRKEVVDIAILAAEKVIEKNLDEPTQRRLVQQVVEQSGPKKG